jgi:hypothetical protein
VIIIGSIYHGVTTPGTPKAGVPAEAQANERRIVMCLGVLLVPVGRIAPPWSRALPAAGKVGDQSTPCPSRTDGRARRQAGGTTTTTTHTAVSVRFPTSAAQSRRIVSRRPHAESLLQRVHPGEGRILSPRTYFPFCFVTRPGKWPVPVGLPWRTKKKLVVAKREAPTHAARQSVGPSSQCWLKWNEEANGSFLPWVLVCQIGPDQTSRSRTTTNHDGRRSYGLRSGTGALRYQGLPQNLSPPDRPRQQGDELRAQQGRTRDGGLIDGS